jgi:hypothetical protein
MDKRPNPLEEAGHSSQSVVGSSDEDIDAVQRVVDPCQRVYRIKRLIQLTF